MALAYSLEPRYPRVVENRASLSFKVDLPGGENRLRELALYVCKKCAEAERFGKVKLNKILWRSDFEAFRARRIPVTGRPYQKLAAGPAPEEMPRLLDRMISQGAIEINNFDHGNGNVDERPKALIAANLMYFS